MKCNGSGADLSGGGRNLDLFGGVGFAQGLFGQALDLHGNPNQYAARPGDDQIFDFGAADFTLQVWVRFNQMSGEQTLLATSSATIHATKPQSELKFKYRESLLRSSYDWFATFC